MATKQSRPCRLTDRQLARALTRATKRKEGLRLRQADEDGRPTRKIILVKNEMIPVRFKDGTICLILGNYELRAVRTKNRQNSLHQWGDKALAFQALGKSGGRFFYGHPGTSFKVSLLA